MMIRGVLFDFDGTLTRPGSLDFPAIKAELGCPLDQPILEFLATLPRDRRSDLMKILDEMEDRAGEESRPNRCAEKCLSILKQKGFVIGILTRNSLSSVKKALVHFKGVTIHDFSAIITRDAVPIPKPRPEGARKAAKQMGLPPSEILVVGDYRFDVMAGKAAGAYTALLTNGKGSAMKAGDPEPDYIIGSLEEIIDILGLLKK
jgi:HAD superfamily hydrolase (TIGR01509 family)